MPLGSKNFRVYQERKSIQKQYSKDTLQKLVEIRGKPFWIEDPIKHEELWHKSAYKCCFNHIIGLPWKDNKPHIIYDYEIEIIKYLGKYKHIWLKKARGLGVTELLLRYMGWLALSTNTYRHKRFVIVTGPKVKIAWDLIARLKILFQDYVLEEDRLDTLRLNGVILEAFPSNTISMRGYQDFKFILLDESDYFQPHEQEEVIAAARGYIAKTNPWIVMVSTPHEPNSLFHRIEQMKSDEEAGFKRLQYLYERGVGKIYDPYFIEEEKKQAYFKREYERQYGIGVGNVLNQDALRRVEELGRRLTDFDSINPATIKSMGIDAGYGSSKTAFVIVEWIDGYARVIYAEAFERAEVDRLFVHAYNLARTYDLMNPTNRIFIDAAAPEFTRTIKRMLGDNPEFEQTLDNLRREGTDPIWAMQIVPIPFSVKHKQMLEKLIKMANKGNLAVNPDRFPELTSDLNIAKSEDLKLDKKAPNTLDLLDGLRLALERFA
jgi:hypothetical protein